MRKILGGKKKHKQAEAQDPKPVDLPVQKKKRKDQLASVLEESVVDSALVEMQDNSNFLVYRDNQPLYVTLDLKTSDIGGLSKKTSSDEDKGDFVNKIQNGLIKTYITPELLDKNELLIIPTEDTVSTMDTFSMLQRAPYYISFVTPDNDDGSKSPNRGQVETTGYTMTLDQAISVANGESDVMDLLADAGVEWAVEDDDEDESTLHAGVVDDDEDQGDLIQDYEYEDDEMDDLNDVYLEEEISPQQQPVIEGLYQDANGNLMTAPELEAPVNEEANVIDAASFEQAAQQIFRSEELGIDFSSDLFDSMVPNELPFKLFEEEREPGWINENLNEISRAANSELMSRYNENRAKERAYFNAIIARGIPKIESFVDPTNPDTPFYHKKNEIEEEYEKRIYESEKRADEKKAELQKRFDEAKHEAGEAGRLAAERYFTEQRSRAFEDQLLRVDQEVAEETESWRMDQLRQLNEDRRLEAQKKRNVFLGGLQEELNRRVKQDIQQEQQLYQELNQNILNFLEENRKADVAWIDAQQKIIANDTRVQHIQAEYDHRAQELEENYNKRLMQQREEDGHNQSRLQNDIAYLKAKLARVQEDNVYLQSRIDNVEEEKQQAREEGKKSAKKEKKALQESLDQAHAAQKQRTIFLTSAMVVGIVIAGLLGALVGNSISGRTQTQLAQDRMYALLQEQQSQTSQPSANSKNDSDEDDTDKTDTDAKDKDDEDSKK